MRLHELAAYFPMIEGEEFDLLVKDIRDNGQLIPIITVDGQILDGSNRYRACTLLGIEPIMKEYEGKDPLHYVISTNIRRRHLDVSQRAMLATKMLPAFEAQAKERQGGKQTSSSNEEGLVTNHQGFKSSSVQVAQEFGVSAPSVQRAKRVAEQAPEKVAGIIAGKETVGHANDELRQKANEDRKAKAVAEGRTQKTELEMRVEEQQYLLVLESIIAELPKLPPVDWGDKFFGQAQGYAQIIINRLGVFNE